MKDDASIRRRRTFGDALLRWYDRERRDLPWRRLVSPYRTLVSELMLQQTVVATVIPYFERFIARFPDLSMLAAAEEDEVLALWSGLGYYARARNLHRAARRVVEHHRGELPPIEAELRALPGIGEYTAAAVAAIAFGARTFALDGNAARVVARLFGVADPIDRPKVRARLRARGQLLVPARRTGDFAQAVMELGARVCVSGMPRCGACPVATACEARANGHPEAFPVRIAHRPKRAIRIACVAVKRRGRWLLVLRAEGTLLGGTWSFPWVELGRGDTDGAAGRRALAGLGLAATGPVESAGTIRHIFTHRDLTARVLRASVRGEPRGTLPARWVAPEEIHALALSSFARKTLALVRS